MSDRSLISHSPFGRGHPYRLEPDQRVPPVPTAGEPVELRATAAMTVTRLVVEAKVAGRRIELTATRVGQLDADLAAAGAPMVQVGSKRRRPERWAW